MHARSRQTNRLSQGSEEEMWSTGKARARHGLFRCDAFGAAHITERPILRRPSIQYAKVVLRFISPARMPSRLTSSRFARYARIVAFCEVPIHIAQQCGPFDTYRRVSVRLVWRFVDA